DEGRRDAAGQRGRVVLRFTIVLAWLRTDRLVAIVGHGQGFFVGACGAGASAAMFGGAGLPCGSVGFTSTPSWTRDCPATMTFCPADRPSPTSASLRFCSLTLTSCFFALLSWPTT